MTLTALQLPPGIVRGANPDDAPGRWFDGSLIRWRQGIMEPVGGWSRITTAALASTPARIHQWRRNANATSMTLVGCDSHLYADDSGTYVNVSPSSLVPLSSASDLGYGTTTYGTGTYGTARSGTSTIAPRREAWTFANWGEDVLAVSSSDGRLLYYSSATPSTAAKTVGVYPISTISRTSNVTTIDTTTAHNLTSGEAVRIAGVTDATFNASSAVATVTGSTTFTYPNTGTNGSSSGGTVQDLSVPTNNRAVVVTPERHVMLIGAGGNPRRLAWSSREDYTDWNFSSVTNTSGFLELQSETPLVTGCKVREGTLVWSVNRAFLARYVGLPYIHGVDELGSARLYAPNAFAEFNGRCVWMDAEGFYSYGNGSIQPLPSPLVDYVFSNIDPLYGPRKAHASANGLFPEIWFFYPSNGSTECDRAVVWNWSEDWWSIALLPRAAAFPAGVGEYPVMASSDGHIWRHEDGWNYGSFDYASNIYVTSGTLNLPGDEQSMNISQVIPSNGGNYNMTKFTFYSRMAPSGDERTFGPYNSRPDGYVDTRVTGRDVRVKIGANAAGDWSIGRLRLKIGSAGGRR